MKPNPLESKTLTQSWNVVDADLVVDGDADDGRVVAASDGIDVLARGQKFEAGDECGVSLLDPLQFLEQTKKIRVVGGGRLRDQTTAVRIPPSQKRERFGWDGSARLRRFWGFLI